MTNQLENVEVELEPGFPNYYLPPEPNSLDDLAEAVRGSWHLLQVAPLRVTAPLLAACYAAPLSEILVLDATLWLWGGTGSYKSTIAALFLSHFGDFSEDNLSLNFEWTSNALEKMLFLAKDVLTVVDDWRPGVTRAESQEMDRKAQRILRIVGNRQGRGRMSSDTTLRGSYAPRGAVMVTAEALPEGPTFQSAAARAFAMNLSEGEVDLAKVSDMQKNKAMLPVAMAGYVRYVASEYEELASWMPDRRESLRNSLRGMLSGSHPRTPDNAAVLILAFEQFRDYTMSIGAMEEKEVEEAYEGAREGILEAAKAHIEDTRGGDPVSTFLRVLLSQFEAKRVYVKDRESGSDPPDRLRLGWEEIPEDASTGAALFRPASRAEFVGWADEDYLYFEKEAAYAAVSAFSQRGGTPFGIKPMALWEAMARSGKSLNDRGRNDTTARVEGRSKRVVQVPRTAVIGEDQAL